MDLDTNTAAGIVWALGLAHQYGGAAAALAASGIDLRGVARFEGVSHDLEELLGQSIHEPSVPEAIALGLLAGRVAHQAPRARRLQDPTAFVLDRELVVQAAEGRSILRLPWCEEGLFVGRSVPDITEIPTPVRRLAVENYSAALAGQRGRFTFTSYGHTYSVEAVPVQHDGDGRIEAVLAIAVPARDFASAASGYERTAERLDHSATLAEGRAEHHRLAGSGDAEVAERHAASSARRGAERARANARSLRSRQTAAPADLPTITSRQLDVLELASHGLTSAEIGQQLSISALTVKTHLENVYLRLGVNDRSAAVATALRHGLIQ
jgi:DNA-binding NarL/FixJ family response regulator